MDFKYTGCNKTVTLKQLKDFCKFNGIPIKSYFIKKQICEVVEKFLGLKSSPPPPLQDKIINDLHVVIDEPLIQYYNVDANTWELFEQNLKNARLEASNEYTGFTSHHCRYFFKDHKLYFKVTFIIDLPDSEKGPKKVLEWIKHLHCHEMGHCEIIKEKVLEFFKHLTFPKTKQEIEQRIKLTLYPELQRAHEKFDSITNHGCAVNLKCPKISPCI